MAQDQSFPKIDFTTFILSISSAAFIGLGNSDLELAKQNIDLLELIWEKTKGNRSPDEDKLLEQLLFDTRMRFVDASSKAVPKK